jgi:hypothetical protein
MGKEDGATKKKKDMTIKVMADQVMHSGISVSKDGYKSARMIVKVGDKEYMSISYEWEGEGIPDFVMNLMSFIQANKEELDKSMEEKAAEYTEYSERAAKGCCKGGGTKKKEESSEEEDEEAD